MRFVVDKGKFLGEKPMDKSFSSANQTFLPGRAEIAPVSGPYPHVGQGFNVRIARQKLRLEAPHLADERSLSFNGLAADNPPQGGITSETVGVVHIILLTNAVAA